MKQRCYDRKGRYLKWYGERGIVVCDRWRNSFEAFVEDMGVCPPGLSLDRIDNDGNYEPGNCRWATQREQTNNTRRNVLVSVDGETMTMQQFCDRRGLQYSMFRYRFLDKGLPVEVVVEKTLSAMKRLAAKKRSNP